MTLNREKKIKTKNKKKKNRGFEHDQQLVFTQGNTDFLPK